MGGKGHHLGPATICPSKTCRARNHETGAVVGTRDVSSSCPVFSRQFRARYRRRALHGGVEGAKVAVQLRNEVDSAVPEDGGIEEARISMTLYGDEYKGADDCLEKDLGAGT